MLHHRRQFLKQAAGAAAAVSLSSVSTAVQAQEATAQPKICVFTKFLQDLLYDELARTVRELGFDGVEATVRKNGHVLPERVEEDLPKMIEALKREGVEVLAMAADVVGADKMSERVLKTAAGLGVTWYRMGYYKYDPAREIIEQLDELKPQIRDLATLNRELGVQGLYQNHSDRKYVGATLWDLHRLLQGVSPSEVGSAFDIRHAAVEAGLSWPVIYKLMRPHIGAIFVKDFQWDGKKARHVPLGTGRVDPKFFDLVKQSDFQGPYSLHVEYLGKEGVEANLAALRTDLAKLKSWLA